MLGGGFSDGNESSAAPAAVPGGGRGGQADRLEALKLPPISKQQRDAAYDFTKCLHPQSRICENLKYSLHQLRIRQQQQVYQALVDAVVFGPAEVDSVDVEEVSLNFVSMNIEKSELSGSNPGAPTTRSPGEFGECAG